MVHSEVGVAFEFQYGFGPTYAHSEFDLREPTEQEIIEIMCLTDTFMEQVLRNYTDDNTIDSYGSGISWKFNPDFENDATNDTKPISIAFTLVSTSMEFGGEPVDPMAVIAAVEQLTEEDFRVFITDYVLTVPDGNIFQNVLQVSGNGTTAYNAPPGVLDRATCADDGSAIEDPGAPNSTTPGDGENGTSPTGPADGSGGSPTSAPADGSDGGSGGTGTPRTIDVEFIVSNIDGLSSSDDVNASGLSVSWPVFVEETVQGITDGQRRRQLRSYQLRRRLNAAYAPGTASINSITRTDCGENAHPEAACHDVQASYDLLITGDDVDSIEAEYSDALNIAVNDGTYQSVLDREEPDTPLYIGIIPPDEDASSPSSSPGEGGEPGGPTDGSGGDPTDGDGDGGSPGGGSGGGAIGDGDLRISDIFFLVSNLEGFRNSADVNASGLSESWPMFIEQEVNRLASPGRKLRTGGFKSKQQQGARVNRLLAATYHSARIDNIIEQSCGDRADPESICHLVLASYALNLDEGQDPEAVESEYRSATNDAIYDGTYQAVLDDIESPLVIGIILPKDGVAPPLMLEVDFGTGANVDRSPMQPEIDILICNLHGFIEQRLGDATAVVMTNLSWVYVNNTRGATRFQLQFTANSTNAAGEPVDPNVIMSSLTWLDPEASDQLLNDFVRDVSDTDMFFEATRALIREPPEEQPAEGSYDVLECPLPSPAPTMSSAPSTSPAPSTAPTITMSPTSSSRPSLAPSVSLSPTMAPSGGAIITFPPQTLAPVAGGPVADPWQFRSTGIFPIRTEFVVSNLEGITQTIDVRQQGLYESWPVFAKEIASNITVFGAGNPSSPSKRQLQHHGRRLSVVYVPDSAVITEMEEIECIEGAHKDSTCHNAKAEWKYEIVDEIYLVVNQTYYNATEEGTYNGTYQDILNREKPGTPLRIGFIGPDGEIITPDGGNGERGGVGDDDDDDKMAGWAIFLIVLLVLLCCCLCLAILYYFFLRKQDDDVASYHEEDFAYDFFIPKNIAPQTEADDVRNKAVILEEYGSTASSDEGPVDAFVDEDDEVELEEDEIMLEPEEVENVAADRGGYDTDEWNDSADGDAESIKLLQSDDAAAEEWQDENDDDLEAIARAIGAGHNETDDEPEELAASIGTGDYASEAHRLLLDNGDDENVAQNRRSSVEPPGDGSFVFHDDAILPHDDPDGRREVENYSDISDAADEKEEPDDDPTEDLALEQTENTGVLLGVEQTANEIKLAEIAAQQERNEIIQRWAQNDDDVEDEGSDENPGADQAAAEGDWEDEGGSSGAEDDEETDGGWEVGLATGDSLVVD